jgi:inner membrane protein involved in colicin E2 resistance
MRPIQWWPLIGGVAIAEIVPLLVLVGMVLLLGPAEEHAAGEFAARLVRYVGPIGGTLMAFFVAERIGRRSSAPVHQGLLLGTGLAVLDFLLLGIAGAGFAWLILAGALRILFGGAGGALAAANRRALLQGS